MAFPVIPPATALSSPAIFSDHNLHHNHHSVLPLKSQSLHKSHSHPLSFSNLNPSAFLPKPPDSAFLCSCLNGSSADSPCGDDDNDGDWSFLIKRFFTGAVRKLDDLLNSRLREGGEVELRERGAVVVVEAKEVEDWDWERWQKHFKEVEDMESLISVLKSQLTQAVDKEDYEDASRLKVAIAAAAAKDAVGSVMSYLKAAIDEERYQDAVFMRDNAGTGLVGWWAGVSDDANDPYGCIIRIKAEHGRYVARSYSPRQLATSTAGIPLFEIFLTLDEKGKYRQQAVYLKRKAVPETAPSIFPKSSNASSSMKKMNSNLGKTDIFTPPVEDIQDDEDMDDPELADGFPGFQNTLQDMIPGVRVRVLKVTASGKVDQDLISKVVEQIIEEEDEENDIEAEIESVGSDDTEDGIPSESEEEKDDGEIDADSGNMDKEDRSEIGIKVVFSGLVPKLSGIASPRDLVRVPAKLKPKGRKSFSFCVHDDEAMQDSVGKGVGSLKKKAKTQGPQSVDRVISDLVKFISRGEKIPVKVLKDVGDLISLTLTQAQNRQPLSGSTTFNRIDLPVYPDPLNGLYIGSHGPYSSEVIQLKRKFGQWQEDDRTERSSDLNFYEYVEAVKLTGDPYVPAGQVAFRAKVGKRYQLPHKGIIPEEFGVIARYKGQGRLAEPGFRNPRWVDGELVILDRKYIKGGPVVGFVYWAPEYQFLVFFNRLRIEE